VRSLRWKLVLTSLLLVFVPVYLLNRQAITFFDRFTRSSLEEHLKNVAFAVGEGYRLSQRDGEAADAGAGFPAYLRAMADETKAHIRVLDPAGEVLFDSESGRDVLTGSRPEIAAARSGAYSARCRLTADRQYMYYYIARPIKTGVRDIVCVVYVVRHTGPIIGAINRMISDQRRATAAAVAVAAVTAAAVAWTLTRRLRLLTRSARDYAARGGPFDPRVKGNDEIGVLAGTLRGMASEIEARNGYNRDFVSTTIHELRTPLTAIQGAVELLEQGAAENPAARAKFLGNIRRQSARMIRLVGELRELTRMDTDLLKAPTETVDYASFLRDAVARLEEVFDQPRAACSLQVEEGIEPRVALMPDKIEQVMSNLLENAFRYTPVSGAVTVRVRVENGLATTEVEDTGPGIAPSNLSRVFDRFFTTESRDRSTDYGSGLGLYIARRIVESHGGTISAANVPGGGARISFSLPVIQRG